MVGRGDSSGTGVDPDDWFSNADSASNEEPLAGGDEPTWLEDVAEPEEQAADNPFARRRLLAFAVALLVLVVAAVVWLIAFSGGGSGSPPEATTTTQATTPAATVPATTPAPSTPAVLPAGVLKPGATGAEVKTLQRALARAGHSPGSIDGDYGPTTEQAVAALQRSAGITADGIYGPETRKALLRELTSG